MRKGFIAVIVLLGLIIAYGWFEIRTSAEGAAASADPSSEDVRVISEVPTWFGKSIVFEAVDRGTFGVAQLKHSFGLLWRYSGGSFGYTGEPGKPFRAAGYESPNDRGTQQFVVGVKVADPGIKFISIGSKRPGAENLSNPSNLSLADVKADPAVYQVAPVVDGYAILVADKYNESTWTIRAFNAEGKLVADEIPGADPRWLITPGS